MKNKIKYIVLPCILVISLLFLAAYGVRIPFGTSYWKDTLVNTIVTNKSIYLQPGDSIYYYTGSGATQHAAVTSGTGGGGIAASDNTTFTGSNTFSGINTYSNGTYFNDSAKFTRIVIMDSLRVGTTYHGTTKTLTAANVNYNLENSFEWQNRNSISLLTLDSANGLNLPRKKIYSSTDSISSDSKFYFSDIVKLTDSLVLTSVDIFASNGKGLNWGETVGQIYSNSSAMEYRSASHNFNTVYGNTLFESDSLTGFNVKRKLEGMADTITSASKWTFSDLVNFATTVTFTVSPVFSALVNFANGITTTTITASSTATFNGFTQIGNLGIQEKTVTKKFVLQAVNSWDSVAHGIPNFKNITSMSLLVKHDSAVANGSKIIPGGGDPVTSTAIYKPAVNYWADTLYFLYLLPTLATGLVGDTVIIRATYTNEY